MRWNRTLERVTELERRIEKHVSEIPVKTPTTPGQFATLATDLKVIWRDPATDARLKKRIVRELIREVIADNRLFVVADAVVIERVSASKIPC